MEKRFDDVSDLTEYALTLKQEKDNLIKYLKDKIKGYYIGGTDICSSCIIKARKKVYKDILERVYDGKSN